MGRNNRYLFAWVVISLPGALIWHRDWSAASDKYLVHQRWEKLELIWCFISGHWTHFIVSLQRKSHLFVVNICIAYGTTTFTFIHEAILSLHSIPLVPNKLLFMKYPILMEQYRLISHYITFLVTICSEVCFVCSLYDWLNWFFISSSNVLYFTLQKIRRVFDFPSYICYKFATTWSLLFYFCIYIDFININKKVKPTYWLIDYDISWTTKKIAWRFLRKLANSFQ